MKNLNTNYSIIQKEMKMFIWHILLNSIVYSMQQANNLMNLHCTMSHMIKARHDHNIPILKNKIK